MAIDKFETPMAIGKAAIAGAVTYALLGRAPKLAPALAVMSTFGARPARCQSGKPKIQVFKPLEPMVEGIYIRGLLSVVAGIQLASLLRSSWKPSLLTPLLAYSAAELIYTKGIVTWNS